MVKISLQTLKDLDREDNDTKNQTSRNSLIQPLCRAEWETGHNCRLKKTQTNKKEKVTVNLI